MIIVNVKMIEFAKKELTPIIMRLGNITEEAIARQILGDIVNVIDWNNSSLMHKGLSCMAKNYLIKQNMV